MSEQASVGEMLSLEDSLTFESMGKLKAFSLALLLSCTYVGSLYVAPEKYGRLVKCLSLVACL